MTFVSYAQNFEDVMLYRALKSVKAGFYIDVGANLPEAESVTKAFYDLGWCGINIEPTDGPFAALESARPRDINLQIGCWSDSGVKTLYLVDESEAFATFEPAMAELHRSAARTVREVTFDTMTLRDICAKYVGDHSVHFLKIDVEGGEANIIRGADFSRWRPWIILAEAHGPDILVNHYQPWEDLLVASQYRYAYCDGLNRFYLAEERWDSLSRFFLAPPNVYDDFVRVSEVKALERAEFAERTRAEAWAALESAQGALLAASQQKQSGSLLRRIGRAITG
jgi:FkbM family methyltransferase